MTGRSEHGLIVVSAAQAPWGAEASLRSLLPALRQEYSSIVVLVPTEETARAFSGVDELTVRRVPAGNKVLYLCRSFARIVIASKQTDVLIFSLQLVPIVALLRIFRPRMRTVVDLHDAPRGALDRLAVRCTLPFASQSIVISTYVAKHLKLKKPTIIPRPIAPTGAQARPPGPIMRVGVVGRVDPEKRIDLAIRAVGSMPSNVELHVFGESLTAGEAYAVELKQLAAELAPGRVHFEGRQRPADIFSAIDVLYVGNENEPSGRSVGEGMWAGVPVVTPVVGGAREFYEDGISGLGYAPNNLDSLRSALLQLLDPQERERVGSGGARHIALTRKADELKTRYAHATRRTEQYE